MAVAVEIMAAPAVPVSAKARLRAWVKQTIEGEGTLRAPDVATLAVQELSADRDFLADFGQEMLKTAVYELVLDVISEGRSLAGDISSFQTPGSAPATSGPTDDRTRLKRRLALLERRYASWWEHVEGKGHVVLLEMTAADLELAEAERRARGTHEVKVADFLAALRKRLDVKQATQTVGERFTDLDQIEFVRAAMLDRKVTAIIPDKKGT